MRHCFREVKSFLENILRSLMMRWVDVKRESRTSSQLQEQVVLLVILRFGNLFLSFLLLFSACFHVHCWFHRRRILKPRQQVFHSIIFPSFIGRLKSKYRQRTENTTRFRARTRNSFLLNSFSFGRSSPLLQREQESHFSQAQINKIVAPAVRFNIMNFARFSFSRGAPVLLS